MNSITTDAAYNAVDAILHDLKDRRGLKHAWYEIDEGLRAEIRERWAELVDKEVRLEVAAREHEVVFNSRTLTLNQRRR